MQPPGERDRVLAIPVTHAAPRFSVLPPLSLYIHIPWCVRKCPYCDFNSHEACGAIPEQHYVDALIADLDAALPRVWGRRVYTVFFGGGTPSIFSAAGIEQIISAVRARVPLAAEAEITMEANPGTFEAEKFRAFRAAGINRLSIGIQSFNPAHLKALGRIHDDKEAHAAIEMARRTFDNINLDIMYGLPGQQLAEATADIERAIIYAPQHLSAYHLTLEPNTYFHRYPPQLPGDDMSADMEQAIEARLAAAGYRHYETSAFSLPGAQSRHNLNYWTFGDYLGIGAGAHSKISFPDRITREVRHRQPAQYIQRAAAGEAVSGSHDVAVDEIPFEFMMNALRLANGFAIDLFAARAGIPLNAAFEALAHAERRGLIVRDHQRIAPTALGRRFLNDLLQIFLPDGAPSARATPASAVPR
jgi:putative oxygen-independent coproporphyrinogen III oxidase